MRTPDELIADLVEKYAGPTPFLRNLVREALSELASALAAPPQTPQRCPFNAGEPTGWWSCSCGAEHQAVVVTPDPPTALQGQVERLERFSPITYDMGGDEFGASMKPSNFGEWLSRAAVLALCRATPEQETT
jgi:hypothetical protein